MHTVYVVSRENGVNNNNQPYVCLTYSVDNQYYRKVIRNYAITCMKDVYESINIALKADHFDPTDCHIVWIDEFLNNVMEVIDYAIQR